jgi:hypothetical protein
MKPIECSKEAPWGIHQTLRDLECPRCGWAPERCETDPAAVLPEAAEQLGWAIVIGGLSQAAAAA